MIIFAGNCARSSTDRASDYGSEGLGFESLRARTISKSQEHEDPVKRNITLPYAPETMRNISLCVVREKETQKKSSLEGISLRIPIRTPRHITLSCDKVSYTTLNYPNFLAVA
jgi:hypothetical protein